MMAVYDTVVVGAGPAGLTAAAYLARFRRRVLVLADGHSRARWIPESHNTPGFPGGVGGPELLSRLAEQAAQFGVQTQALRVERLVLADGGFELSGPGPEAPIFAPTVLLATGVADRLPDIPDLESAIRAGVVRMCPICDAYEAIGKRLAVLGDGDPAEREAAFLRTYSDDVTIVRDHEGALAVEGAHLRWTAPGGTVRIFDHLYLALGCRPRSDLAVSCGARLDHEQALLTDSHQMTTVEGLYAAGDVVRGLNQIAVAAGEAAIAATAIHNRLRTAGT